MKTWEQPSPEVLKKVVRDFILRHPDRHNQKEWVSTAHGFFNFTEGKVDSIRARLRRRKSLPSRQGNPDGLCGTTACVAGWAGILGSPPGTKIIVPEGRIWDTHLAYPDGTSRDIEPAAAELLGMDQEQANWLFDPCRSRTEVLRALKHLIEDPEANLRVDADD